MQVPGGAQDRTETLVRGGFRSGARVDFDSGFSAAAEVVGGREPWPRATVMAAAAHTWLRLLVRGLHRTRRGRKEVHTSCRWTCLAFPWDVLVMPFNVEIDSNCAYALMSPLMRDL